MNTKVYSPVGSPFFSADMKVASLQGEDSAEDGRRGRKHRGRRAEHRLGELVLEQQDCGLWCAWRAWNDCEEQRSFINPPCC